MDLIEELKRIYQRVDEEPIGDKKAQRRIRKSMNKMDRMNEKLLRKINRESLFDRIMDSISLFKIKRSFRRMDKITKKYSTKIGKLGPIVID